MEKKGIASPCNDDIPYILFNLFGILSIARMVCFVNMVIIDSYCILQNLFCFFLISTMECVCLAQNIEENRGKHILGWVSGCGTCACLDTSGVATLVPKTRFARFGEPRSLRRDKHTPRHNQTKKIQSRAMRACALNRLHKSRIIARWLFGFISVSVPYLLVRSCIAFYSHASLCAFFARGIFFVILVTVA